MLIKKQINNVVGYFFVAVMISLGLTSQAIAGWQLEWIDNFDGNRVNKDNWTAQDQANYNNEVQCYTDDDTSANKNYDVSNGTLKIISRRQNNNCAGLNGTFKSWTSGRLNSKDKKEFLYGRIESRLRFNTLKSGTWPAFWMLENRIKEQPIAGDNDHIGWPDPGAGEIDVWEWFSGQPHTYITNFFNMGGCGSKVNYTYPNGAADVLQWHTYAMEWTQNTIQFFIDDTLISSQNISSCAQYKEPMFVLLNVAMGGTLGGAIDSTLNSATLEVDYVAHCTASNANSLNRCVQSDNPDSGVVVADDISIFEGSESSSWVGWDCCANSNPATVIDDTLHGEVMEFHMTQGETVVGFISRSPEAADPAPFDASTFMASGTLEFDLKMTTAPTSGGNPLWKLKAEGGGGPNAGGSAAEVNLSTSVEGHAAPVLNVWQHYSFKLSDLASSGLSLNNIDLIMVFPSWGEGNGAVFRVDNLEILSNQTQVTSPQGPIPFITSTAITSAMTESAYNYQIQATGSGNLAFSAAVLPSWLTFNNATGVLSGTPSVDDIGEHQVTLVVSNSDGTESVGQPFTINVTAESTTGDGGGGSTNPMFIMLLGIFLVTARLAVFKQAS